MLFQCNDPTSSEILTYIDQTMVQIQKMQYVSRTSSIATLIKQVHNGSLPRSSEEIRASLEKIPQTVQKQYLPSNLLCMGLITLQPGLSDARKESAMNTILSFIDTSHIPPGLSVKLTGETAFMIQMKKEMGKSFIVLICTALVLMVILMGIVFSYVHYRFLPAAIVAIGILFTFGVVGIIGIPLSLATIAAFPVLIGLGIDYAIQFHSRLEEEARTHELAVAIRNTITRTGPAVMYAMLATMMGFVAIFISPVPMIRGFGQICTIGVVVCYITALVCVPLIAILVQYTAKGAGKSPLADAVDQSLSKIAILIGKRPLPTLFVVFLVALGGLQLDSKIPIETNQDSFVPPDMPAKMARDTVTRTVGVTDPAPLILTGDVTSLDTIRWMKEFTDHELSVHTPGIHRALSIADYVLAYNNGTMPEIQSDLNNVLTKIPLDIKKQYLNGHIEAVVLFYLNKMNTKAKDDLKRQMYGDLMMNPPPPGIRYSITGGFDLFTTLITSLVQSKDLMTGLGFLLVTGFLAFMYRNIRSITPIVPIIAIVGWNAVAMYLLGLDYNPMTACLGSMTIGVSSEYTILVMERYMEEKEKCGSTLQAIGNSVSKIGSAILASGLTTFFGFSALILSDFPIISNFGLTTIIAVLFSLIGAIVIMPALLSLIATMLPNSKA